MELKKCPFTGFNGYEFKVDCDCYCHAPGYKEIDWLFMPCCSCIHSGRGSKPEKVSVWLYPLDQFEPSSVKFNRMSQSNQRTIQSHPELLELIKIENIKLH